MISNSELTKRFAAPNAMKELFRKYLAANNCEINLDKIIASVAFFDARTIASKTTVNFFQGETSNSYTNLQQFRRPETEHMLILGLMLWTANNATIEASAWDPGSQGLAKVQNSILSLNVAGKNVLDSYDCSMARDAVTTQDNGLIALGEPILWPGQTQLNATLTLQVAGAASDNVKLGLIGLGLIS